MRYKYLIILIIIIFLNFNFGKISAEGWTIYKNAPILYPEPFGTTTEGRNNIYAPEVIKEGILWRMWYGGQGNQQNGNDRIHYAESSDGINWVKKGVVIDIQAGEVHVNDPTVIKINGVYYMYFTVSKIINGSGVDVIDYAISNDGLGWNRQGTVLSKSQSWEGGIGIARPSVIADAGVYKMWYDSITPSSAKVGYATSPDGKVWNKYDGNPVLTESIGAVDVKKILGTYYMVHQPLYVKAPVGWLTSSDGINWSSMGPLINKTGGADDYNGHVTPFIYVENGIWSRTYFGGMWGDANNQEWTRGRIFMAYRFLNTCKVQGLKLYGLNDIPSFSSFLKDTIVSSDYASSIDSPYFIGVPEGTHLVSINKPTFYNVGYTMCINSADCHYGPWTLGNSVFVNCSNNRYIDLWWHFYPEKGDVNKDFNWDLRDIINLVKNLLQ